MSIRNIKKSTSRDTLRKSKSQSRKYILNEGTKFIITEAYNTARTNLVFALSQTKNKAISFTSSSPAEGKSTTCLNMAITLASTGAKVLLIDLDLRKPVLHSLLKLNRTVGSSTILSGMCTVSEAICKNVRPNLDLIPSGPIPPNPAELLSSPNTGKLIEVLRTHYDYILIDTPPVNIVTDSQLLNNYIAGTVFIIRDNYTRHTEIQKALNQIKLANGKVLGFIKTACQVSGGSGYYKNSYYNYNYSYSEPAEDKDLSNR